MKDLFKSYKQQRLKTHLGIFALSGFLAVGINSVLFQNIDSGLLKASILDTPSTILVQQEAQKADIVLDVENNTISLSNTKNIENIKEFSFSLLYDPTILEISQVEQEGVSIISQTPGITTFIMSYNEALSLEANNSIINITYTKKQDKTVYLNISNLNFKDSSGEIYLLSSQGTIF